MSAYIPPSKRGHCTGCQKHVYRSRTSAKVPYCRDCRSAGKAPSRAVHGTTRRYRLGCRCDECRRAKSESNRGHLARNGPQKHKVEARACRQCGEGFEARKSRPSAFCSRSCRGEHQRQASEARRRSDRRRLRFEQMMAEAAAGTTGGNRVWVQGDCLVCSDPFMSPGLASRYCSRECRAIARTGIRWISFEDRRAIYLRDGWACQICSEGTSHEWSQDDPWSPTLDHIVPRSKGGTDDPENLRLAHAWCNSVRGDLSHYTDKDLQEVA